MNTVEGRLKQTDKKIDDINVKIEKHRSDIEVLITTKVDVKTDKKNRRELKKQMFEISEEHGVLTN